MEADSVSYFAVSIRDLHIVGRCFPDEATGDIMRQIAVISAGLVLVGGVVAADAQGIGYAPGVNPSNPQDLTHRSNPQDLLAPGGSNPQDLVRRPSGCDAGKFRS